MDREFHQEIWDQLMIIEQIDNKNYEIKANILCNYEQVSHAAQEVQKLPQFQNEKKIQNLTFSPGWICKFIAMNDMTRRRSTAQGDKEINTNDEINLELQKAHDKINEEVIKQIKDNSVL